MKMDPFDEPMAGKGSTPMENDYLAFADSKRKAGTPWAEIPLFRDWVELRYAEVRRLREALTSGIEITETLDEFNEPGSDAWVWLKTSRELLEEQ